jgi:hypothetical protein
LQIKLGALNSLLMAGVLGLIMLFSNQGEEIIQGQNGQVPARHVPAMGAMICNLIANRFIGATKPGSARPTGCANY